MISSNNIIAELTQNNTIKLYTKTPKRKEIVAYKKRILLSPNIGFSYLKTNNYQVIEDFIKKEQINFQDISYRRKLSKEQDDYGTYFEISENYHELDPKKRKLVDAYIEGAFERNNPKQIISDSNEVEYPYLIDTSSNIEILRNTFGVAYQIGVNLCLPHELYILQLLEANQISKLNDTRFRKQAELFTITPYKEISLESVEELEKLGLIPIDTYNHLLDSTKQTGKILRLMQKQKGN